MDFWKEIILPRIDGKEASDICNQPDEKYKGIPLYSSYGIHGFQVEEYIRQRNEDIHRFSIMHEDVDICFKWASYIGMCCFVLIPYLFVKVFFMQLFLMVTLPCAYYLVLRFYCIYRVTLSHSDFRIERFLNDLFAFAYVYEKDKIIELKNKSFHHLSVKGYAIDIGLSVYWSNCNIGAYSECYGNLEYGYDYDENINGCHFEWGETGPNQKICMCNVTIQELKRAQIIDNSKRLAATYDAATINWGKPWRMPSYDEAQELIDLCKWEYCNQGGQDGYKITGPNGYSIFLPIGGVSDNGDVVFHGMGFYWIGQLNFSKDKSFLRNYKEICANVLSFSKNSKSEGSAHINYLIRNYGCLIRPVADKDSISPINDLSSAFDF